MLVRSLTIYAALLWYRNEKMYSALNLFADVIGQIVGVSQLAYVRMPTNTTDTPKQVTAFIDDRYG